MKMMRHNMNSWLVIITTCLVSYSATAQNYKDDMEKIRVAYKSQYHSFSIKYLYYPYDSIKRATDSIKGTCIVDSEYWYYKIRSSAGEVEYLKNGKYFIDVNHANKVIMITKSSVAKSDFWDINKVDSLLRLPTISISYKERGIEGEYTVSLDQGSWNKIKLVFNRKRNTMDEIWLYSTAQGKILGEPYKKPVIGIFYTSYSEAKPAKNNFNEGKYVQENKEGDFEGIGVFKGFKMLDYIHNRT